MRLWELDTGCRVLMARDTGSVARAGTLVTPGAALRLVTPLPSVTTLLDNASRAGEQYKVQQVNTINRYAAYNPHIIKVACVSVCLCVVYNLLRTNG